ncbi:glycosyltransferase family 2 protein [Calocera viscosa TUFC12733]|uniref:chitin synthase n=1 Tax=Calocera viscosa (strain TUFC12733) TaxID=1330018 RepID=A0A167NU91_CALVF|nr:glycosyltransferase family 2 protein [Calocera viscosa TUFC12733]
MSKDGLSLRDLTELVSATSSSKVYPSEDAVVQALHTRFRADYPYTNLGSSSLVVVNPFKVLASSNDANARAYEEKSYRDTDVQLDQSQMLQPHVYDMAAKVYLMMRRRNESQSVILRGITGSGKSFSSKLLVNQLLRLSARTKKEARVADHIAALQTVLDSFGCSKTTSNPSATRFGKYLELHFGENGRISGAQVLTFGLDKSRLLHLTHDERTYHVFYQLIAGATSEERDSLSIEDPSSYALLASSGCYRLPAGPFSDDGVAMEELRAAMASLGFKAKHTSAIWSLLIAILLLGNLHFNDNGSKEANYESARLANPAVLDQVAHLLGVPPDELEQCLTNKTNYIRKELYTVLLTVEAAAHQRDRLVADLYSILFAYVVETANQKVASPADGRGPPTQIVLLDGPGYQSRTPTGSMSSTGPSPLISVNGQNGFDEFCINFSNEVVQSYVLRRAFDDTVGYNGEMTADEIALPSIATMDNGACIEMLRGVVTVDFPQKKPGGMLAVLGKACSNVNKGKAGERPDEELLQELVNKFGVHGSFVASPGPNTQPADRMLFGINHYSGMCTYDVHSFVERDRDIVDSSLVMLLRRSSNPFVAKLVCGPSLATEAHSTDPGIVVQAQVSSRPLRSATPILDPAGNLPEESDPRNVLDAQKPCPVTTQLNYTISELLQNLDRTRLWNLWCIRPNDSSSPNSFDKRRVRAQVRSMLLADLIARKTPEYVADYDQAEFCNRYMPTAGGSIAERFTACARRNVWTEGVDYAVGQTRVWLAYGAWKMVEDAIRAMEADSDKADTQLDDDHSMAGTTQDPFRERQRTESGWRYNGSTDQLLAARPSMGATRSSGQVPQYGEGGLNTPDFQNPDDWAKPPPTPEQSPLPEKKELDEMVINTVSSHMEEVPSTRGRRIWVRFVWCMTFWMPNFLLSYVGRMKRADVRLAWREKVTIFMLIIFMCGLVLFYIIVFGILLCPNFNKAWDTQQLAQHAATNNYWVAVRGNVYDLTNFYRSQHSDIANEPVTQDVMMEVAGTDVTEYFPVPLNLACSGLITGAVPVLAWANFTPVTTTAVHYTGAQQPATGTKLDDPSWYTDTFLPFLTDFYKGPLVYNPVTDIQAAANNDNKFWAIVNNGVYDLSDYFFTIQQNSAASGAGVPNYQFLNQDLTDLWKQQPGQDISSGFSKVMAGLSADQQTAQLDCLNNAFYVGQTDFRLTARCQVQNYLLLVMSGIIMATMLAKFLAALQLGGKRQPEMPEKFVLCQVPCYTEGEESLRRTIDSLAALNYDDKRKLLFLICDGNIIGRGNDRTTPRIVLDILGVDPKIDPEPQLFKSVGEGSKQINYGKIYSGLYEFAGHVVPYMVVVKVGKPSERSKPGNRGKRDSQVLLMRFLNRVHFDAPMCPLELEMAHQLRNVVGVDPYFYEYIFMVDADTSVTKDSLSRLVASAADDSRIMGICGETKLYNEEGSWWTMIQVYEYYISHHLAKAFESLFGSVTCLPGCFSLYRVRTADKGKPILISHRILDEYSEGVVDTLHKKNLLSLGEDRYLTTLLMKHFPVFRMKFAPDAIAHTVAPDTWGILLSQRRRWINSTIHNLAELVFLPELCGFCCFSMRFIVFLDLLSTIILPATAVYLIYLIVTVATGQAPIPIISLAMIAAVYGLQMVIFLLKREFMLIGWMIIYILAYPVYSFFLPLYSFWYMDDFSWGTTRVVVGEGANKKIMIGDDEKFDDSMIPLKKFSEYTSENWDTSSHVSADTGLLPPKSKAQSQAGTVRTYQQSSMSGDFYRDTNAALAASASQTNLVQPRMRTTSNLSQMTQLHPPMFPMQTGAGSVVGSDHGSGIGFGYGTTAFPSSMYLPNAPRNSVMTNLNAYGGAPSVFGAPAPSMAPSMSMMGGGPLGGARPMSTFSMATTANPFASTPGMVDGNPNPSDEQLLDVLRSYLATQDLMTVTKKTARDAVSAHFPQADLAPRKDYLNQSIDQLLSA